MHLIINGESRHVVGAETVQQLLEQFGLQAQMVVVEHNGEIVQRGRYAEERLAEGDTLEIVQMMAGG
jgi:sulfur carrier protein